MNKGEVASNIKAWRSYSDIITDSLWLLPSRDKAGAHGQVSGDVFHGAFVPQIPYQFIRRYTLPGDWVLDPMCGSGTTLIEGMRLGRNCVGWDINPEAIALAQSLIAQTPAIEGTASVIQRDATTLISDFYINKFQLALLHPPYYDIIKFSDNPNDLSNAESLELYLAALYDVIYNVYTALVPGGVLALVIGDKYADGKLIPLGMHTLNSATSCGFSLKSIIVKDYGETKAKGKNNNLWRYRALLGGFYVFKHEYIYVLEKPQ